MTMIDNLPEVSDLNAMRTMLSNGRRGGRVSERAMYYRKPDDGGLEANWIVIQGSNNDRREDQQIRGFTPLFQFGVIKNNDGENPWLTILQHPKGPAAFPKEQVIQLRWYDDRFCPLPGVRWPQIEGATITEYDCPECSNKQFLQATALARHLRLSHEYERQEIVALGREMNIDFSKEIATGGKVRRTIQYAAPAAPEPEAPRVTVERTRPRRQRATSDDALDLEQQELTDG